MVNAPDELRRGEDGKPNAYKRIRGKLFKAIYVVERNRAILVTIYPMD